MMAVEAMAYGATVVVVDATSLSGVVKAPYMGVAVPQGGSEALAAAIEWLLADPVAGASRVMLGGSWRREHSRAVFQRPSAAARGGSRTVGPSVSPLACRSVLREGIVPVGDNGSCGLGCVRAGDQVNAHEDAASVCLWTGECDP